jgi:hypothetical protein
MKIHIYISIKILAYLPSASIMFHPLSDSTWEVEDHKWAKELAEDVFYK